MEWHHVFTKYLLLLLYNHSPGVCEGQKIRITQAVIILSKLHAKKYCTLVNLCTSTNAMNKIWLVDKTLQVVYSSDRSPVRGTDRSSVIVDKAIGNTVMLQTQF